MESASSSKEASELETETIHSVSIHAIERCDCGTEKEHDITLFKGTKEEVDEYYIKIKRRTHGKFAFFFRWYYTGKALKALNESRRMFGEIL